MNNKDITLKVFEDKELNEKDQILVIGYNETLIPVLPEGTVTIDSSISKIQHGSSQFIQHNFFAKDLTSFNLNKKFQKILSLNTLHLTDNLKSVLLCVQKHLIGEAIIYFPLSPNILIEEYLSQNDLIKEKETKIFQKRTREDVENQVLEVPFNSILIEEKKENITFYSKEDLSKYLSLELPKLITLKDDELRMYSKELTDLLYQDSDKVLTLSTPWILLTLSNETNLIE